MDGDSDSDVLMMSEGEESDFEDFGADDSDDSEDDFCIPAPPAAAKGKKTTAAAGTAAGTKSKPTNAKKATASTAKSGSNKAKSKSVLSTTKASALNAAAATASDGSSESTAKGSNASKTIEETYQKKSQLEHILLRPDTYIGSTERDTAEMYVLQSTSTSMDSEGTPTPTHKIVEKRITYTPGLFKIFDEIVVNAADNKQRDPNMDRLDISIDGPNNRITVKNNGKGIPVVVHKEHGVYVPTLIFGHLLTGSNFDDDEKKTTGGRNGYGAKLANVFSTQFTVECVDADQGVRFVQIFRDNMSVTEKPVVKSITAAEKKRGDYVKITFSPDLNRFKMQRLDDDTVGLLSKRAYDLAGTMASSNGKKLQVSLNGEKLPIKSFKDYLGLFDGLSSPVAYEKTDRWEVGVAASMDATPHQVSFVNSICTSKGGGHVNYIADQVTTHLVKLFNKKKKSNVVKPSNVKNHLTIFVNCLIENPTFDSQTKDHLTSKPKKFGSECKLTDKFLKQVEKSDIVSTIENFVSYKEKEMMKRKGGTKKTKITGITKLDDANFAGTAKSRDCTLIITEGDSAKSLAMSGLSVIGRDYYGVFPLRGKPLNVRDTTMTAAVKNEEIKNLVDILGLKFQTKYDESNVKTLRYGHLMIMADQDTDGSHIKGLVINLIHHYWKSLLSVPNFLQQFITPIVKVSKGKRSMSFFSMPEYENWLESTGNDGKGYKMKYYKGLGTSTSAEAKEYFSNLDLHEVTFAKLSDDTVSADSYDEVEDGAFVDNNNGSSGSDLIDMVFKKDRVSDRKLWLNALSKDTFLDYRKASEEGCVKYSDFINKEYILFSTYDNERSIPHVMDGLKPSQRKVLFACFKRKLKNEIKVAQLTGYIAEHSAYHHGEASLQQTIVNMAHDFVGSNNINLLTPSGQFGTRRMGGKDAASPRYIFTRLEPIARAIFHPDDDELLNYRQDDGVSIEPDFYVPVIPLVLVNGSDGIGTGWSSCVLNYNPREIIANLRRKIAGEDLVTMLPYYSGFSGEIIKQDAGKFTHRGMIERVNDTKLLISELPIKKWTQDYKQFLDGMMTPTETKKGENKPAEITDFAENHTDSTVSFTVTANKEMIDKFEKEKNGLFGKFKLQGSLSTSNMHLFDQEKRIAKYDKPEDILNEFYTIRLDFYVKRKQILVEKLQYEQRMLSNKARFVEEVCSGVLVVSNRKRHDILADLQERKYETFYKDNKKKDSTDSDEEEEQDQEMQESEADLAKGYEYLLGLKIWSLSYEKAEALRAELATKTQELADLQATEPTQLWANDLDAIEEAMDVRDTEIEKAVTEEKKAQKKSKKRQANKASKKKGKGKGRAKKDDWDSGMDTSSDEEDDDLSIDSVVFKPAPRAKKPAASAARRKPAAKPAPKATAALKAKSTASAASKTSSKATKPPVVAPKVAAAAAKPPPASDTEEDDDFGASLMERMQKKLVVSPPGNKPAARSKEAKKRSSPKIDETEVDSESSSDELDDLDVEEFDKASVTPAKKKVAQDIKRARNKSATKAGAASTLDSSVDDMDDDEPVAVATKKKAPARARAGRTTSKQAPIELDEDEESFDFDEDSSSEGEEEPAPAKKQSAAAARGRNGRTTKKVNYAQNDEESSDSDFEFD